MSDKEYMEARFYAPHVSIRPEIKTEELNGRTYLTRHCHKILDLFVLHKLYPPRPLVKDSFAIYYVGYIKILSVERKEEKQEVNNLMTLYI